MALPQPPSSFFNGLVEAGSAALSVLPTVYTYSPYILAFGAVDYFYDWVKENRPQGSSVMVDDFWKYSAKGMGDLSKFALMGFNGPYPVVPPIGGGSAGHQMLGYTSMAPSSYSGSTAMRWGNMGGGLMGASNPGVNRVAGQY